MITVLGHATRCCEGYSRREWLRLGGLGTLGLSLTDLVRARASDPDRGPLLIIDGEKDHTVPWAIANAAFKRQRRNQGVTEIKQIPNRGHSLTIDSGWREVADTALAFVKRFV